MRKGWIGFAAVCCAVMLNISPSRAADENTKTGTDIGDIAPNFEVYDMNGNKVTLKDYKGKKLFVNFWGWWCPPCIREAEALMHVAKKYEGKIEFLFVGVTTFYRDNKPLDPKEFADGFAPELAEFKTGLLKAKLVRPDSTTIKMHPELLPQFETRNKVVVDYYMTSKNSLFDFRGYWERQFRAETNERYGIPVTYLIDGEGRIQLDVNPNDQYWDKNDDILTDFIAGKDLSSYVARFPIPPHHQRKPETAQK
ncbi:MAG: TlpA family protein disulfide reductase [candidate division Zixibacteria bacterium]|nr:TlpA family protein disulfide reductase [candidate division Zixibacteria bacterium]